MTMLLLSCTSSWKQFMSLVHLLESGVTRGLRTLDVARSTLTHMGVNRGSITGSSMHNSRIERLWRDLLNIVIRNVFYYLETQQVLDPDNNLHIYCL